MEILFLISSLASLGVFALTLIAFILNYEDERRNSLLVYLLFIGFIYLVLSGLFLAWSFQLLVYSEIDLNIVYLILIFSQSLILSGFLYVFKKNRCIFFLLFLYILCIILIIIFQLKNLSLYLIASFILMAILFIMLSYFSKSYRKAGYLGIFYALISLIFQILTSLSMGNVIIFDVISILLFLWLSFLLIEKIKSSPPKISKKIQRGKTFYVFDFLKHFIFIIIFSIFILIGTIGLHELGHLAVSKFYKCEYTNIIYSQNAPQTEMLCGNSNQTFLIFGGILLPIIAALILFAVGGRFIKETSCLIIGFSIIAGYKDLEVLSLSRNLIFALMILGIVFVTIGTALFAKSKIEE